jgi:hypothetical protein
MLNLSFLLFALIYVSFGLYMFEWAWSMTKLHRQKDEVRDKNFPATRRNDAPKWVKWHFYPVAALILPARFGLWVLTFVGCYLIQMVIMAGQDFSKPAPKWRKALSRTVF